MCGTVFFRSKRAAFRWRGGHSHGVGASVSRMFFVALCEGPFSSGETCQHVCCPGMPSKTKEQTNAVHMSGYEWKTRRRNLRVPRYPFACSSKDVPPSSHILVDSSIENAR